MRGKRGSIIVFLILLILLGAALYFLYLTIIDINAPEIQFIAEKPASKNQSSFIGQFQFYPNMRFPDKNIKYNTDVSCNQKKITNIQQAINEIESETEIINFLLTGKEEAEIFFSCTEEKIEIKEKYFIAGEGGPTTIINTSMFYIIKEGKVLLFYEKSPCNNYNVELHELLHAFGFKHSDNKQSIMYNTTFCNQVLTSDIIEHLKNLYSIPYLPDLYFSDVTAKKRGHYLDFEVSVKNQGLREAEFVSLELYAEDKKINEFDLKTINYGEGRILTGEDITIPRKTLQISFVIISSDELNKENNFIYLYLPS